jgi:amino acid adenylation domain-containing protein
MTTLPEETRLGVLTDSLHEIRRLRGELAAVRSTRTEPIAIIGMACRMPGGAEDPDAFWEFLRDGGDGISEIPASRFDLERFYDPSMQAAGRMYTRNGGFLRDIDRFDAPFFGISPREAAALDPQQRLLLEVGWEAIEHAGQSPRELVGSASGVFVGVTNYDYCQSQIQHVDPAELEAYCLTSNASTFAAGRLSYWLGLSGPSLSVDTACSSSLVAVHLASQSLRAGECRMALAAGVNVLLSPEWFVVLSRARMLAADGRCKTFDAAADGYGRSEGCGVVVLKRLSDAVAHGDRVLALLTGSAVNQDGRSGGITVPNGAAQQDVLRRALHAASTASGRVSYVEAHGTGTPLGDPIELRALGSVLTHRDRERPLLVGSVKTNVGHLEPAAGIAGLIKVVLSLEHEEIPAHLHLNEVNPEIALDELGVAIPTGATPWRAGDEPRIAGVSSFGASGTNAHVVVQEAPPQPPAEAGSDRPAHLLTLSAKSPNALATLVDRYRERFREPSRDDLADICFTAAAGRAHFPHRLALVGASTDELHDQLGAVATGKLPAGVRRGHAPPGARPRVAFLFTGQGSQYPGMARSLYETEAVFARVLDQADHLLRSQLERPLLSVLHPAPGDEALIDDTGYTQPALFALECALAGLWRSWGIEPDAVLGHSVGELAAACVAGAMTFEDGLALAALRGRLMRELGDGGAMAAVFAPPEDVERALTPFVGSLSIAAVNGPQSVVVAGAGAALQALRSALSGIGVKSKALQVARAFHSPLVDPMLDAFEHEAARVRFAEPVIPIVSNVTGEYLRGEQALSGRYLREHARAPVQFLAGMRTLFHEGHRTFIEIGPAPTLGAMAARFVPQDDAEDRRPAFLASLRKGHDDWSVLLDSLGALYTRGREPDWAGFEAGRRRRRVSLPTYPFQRSRHWFAASSERDRPRRDAPSRSLLGRRVASPLDSIQFDAELSAAAHPCLADCAIDGTAVVNIGVYFEAALAAARAYGCEGPILLEQCLVRQSLTLERDERRRTQLILEPLGDGRAAYRYYAVDRKPGEEPHVPDSWVLHAQGRLIADPTPAATLDVDATRQPLGDHITGADFYAELSRRRLALGDSARWIEEVWHAGGEALARMRAPRAGEAEPYLMHPGLTDAMFQLLFACLPADDDADAAYMIVGIDRFRHCEHDRSQPLHCHARLLPASVAGATLVADVSLYDAAGVAVVEAAGVHLKRVPPEGMRGPQPRSTAAHAASGDRTPTAASPVAGDVIARAPAAERGSILERVLVETVAAALGAQPSDVDVHEPLQSLGLDSLMALEVREALSGELGIELPLVTFLEDRSIVELAAAVLPMLAPAPAEVDDGAATPPSRISRDPEPGLVADLQARHEPFALTDLQGAYLVGRTSAFELGNVSTYFFVEVDVDGVDVDRLTAAFRQLIDRHDMLRAVVSPDGLQRVLPEVPPYEIATVDLRRCDEPERARRLGEIHDEMRQQVFDPETWPLFTIRATRVDERRTRLHVGLDALIIDAWSTSLLFREWALVYRGESDSLPELPITFRDYVLAVRALEGGPAHRRSLEYWRERIATLPAAPDLPLACNPASLHEPVFGHRSSRLPADMWSRFKRHAAAAGVTPSAALCTAYSQVLAEWSTSRDFTLNVLFFNRQPLHPQVSSVVGNFSATTLLEIRGTATDAFADRATQIQKQLWTDLEHSHVSGVQVLRELNRTQGNVARAAMPVVFASTVNFAAKDDSTATTGLAQHLASLGESGREVSSSIRTPQVWLDHQVVEDAGELVVNWDVIEQIFPAGVIDAMFAAYLDVLRELCDDEQAWRRAPCMLVPEADLRERAAVNATAAPLSDGLLHDGFIANAAAEPGRVAVIAPDRTLTYGALERMTNRLDRWLRSQGCGRGSLVAIVMEKGWAQVAATIAILKSGAAYVPIDAGVPAERLRLLLESAGVTVALTQAHVDARTTWPAETVRLCVDGSDADGESEAPPPAAATRPDDLAYVIYTSGSTGMPKGVEIEHASALNTIEDINERFAITPADRVLGLSALNFDLSVYDVFGMLAAGGAIVLPDPGAHREPARWAQLIAEHGVTVWNSVPMLMEMLTEHLDAHGRPALPLRIVMLSGDWIPVALPDRIRGVAPDAALWSLGGATEASIWSILHPIESVDPDWSSIPYGVPMRNQRFYVLDDALRPRPVWATGDLHIGGVGLARGYLHDDLRTKASFIRHPMTGERLYKTGDLGRYRPGGIIEFLGRKDGQVKIQGYRVELGEVEAALLGCPGVRAAVATASGEQKGVKRLVAYVVHDEPAPAVHEQLDRDLRERLPEYLVPQQIVLLDALPLSSNGKVDRAALPSPDDGAAHDGEELVLPRSEHEIQLAEIWAEFFDGQQIGVRASFFDLGGNSLLAVRLMARIQARVGRTLPLSALFARPTIEGLAEALGDADGSTAERRALVPIHPEGERPPFICVHPVGGDVLCYADLARQLDPEQPLYGLQVPDAGPTPQTVPELAALYAEAIVAELPVGPYRIGGWSMGGAVALEIAQQLRSAGAKVESVVLIDLLVPPRPQQEAPPDDSVLLSWLATDLAGLTGREWSIPPAALRDTGDRSPLEVLHADAQRAGVLPLDIDIATFRPIAERFSRNFRALLAYAPDRYDGRVRFVRARDGGATAQIARTWIALCDGDAEVVDVPGDHYTALRPPHVRALADAISASFVHQNGSRNPIPT